MSGPIDLDSHDTGLNEQLRDGVVAEDIPAIFPLLRGRGLLRAFTALFHGGEGQVLLRLLVLRTLGARSNAPEWTPQDIRDHLSFIDPVKLETVVQRLRDHDLLGWDAETQRYRVGALGRKALAALTTLLDFEQDDEDGLGYITSQLAAGQAVGRVSADELGHLLARLSELKDDFDRAVLSGSEHRIHAAAQTLGSVWTWVEKGTAIIEAITEEQELDLRAHRLAQAVGRAQSAMLRQAGIFQRELNKIDQHRIHLGRSGLSSSDLVGWLRRLDTSALCAFASEQHLLPLQPAFVQDQIALDVAEFELLERERAAAEVTALPTAETTPPATDLPHDEEDLSHLDAWQKILEGITEPVSLEHAVTPESYAISAYRLSLLGLIGDPESASLDGAAADLARLPLSLEVEPRLLDVDLGEVRQISAGRISPNTAASPVRRRRASKETPPHA